MANLIIWNSYLTDSPDSKKVSNSTIVRIAGPHELACWLEKFGYSVKVIDFCNTMPPEDVIKITEKHIDSNTIAIGASSTFWNWTPQNIFGEPNWAVVARREIEKNNPKLKWILGGDQILGKPFKFKWQKFHAFAEDSLLQFMDDHTFAKETRIKFDIKRLERHFGDGADIKSHEVLPMQMSRGCQFKCAFCRYPLVGRKKGTYLRDFDLIEAEFLENYKKFGTTRYYFLDETMNEDEEKIKKLADLAQRLPFKLEWIGYIRLDLINARPKSAELLKQSGMKSCFMGIESFHPTASQKVGKGWMGKNGKDYLLKLRDIWKDEITWKLGLIIGLPGEPIESIYETNQWCIDNKMYSWDWQPLHINKTDVPGWKSEFDINYEKYGYRYLNADNDLEWTSDHFTYTSAYRLYDKLADQSHQYRKVAAWRLGEYAAILNKSFDELQHVYVKDINFDDIEIKANKFVKEYTFNQLTGM